MQKMSEEIAIYCLKADSESYSEVCEECSIYGNVGCDHCYNDAINMAIQALEEIQQYRAIGTVDQCREAVERMKPKKPHKYVAFDGIERNGCPRCYEERGRNEILYAGQKYCSVCAQAIDRSE